MSAIPIPTRREVSAPHARARGPTNSAPERGASCKARHPGRVHPGNQSLGAGVGGGEPPGASLRGVRGSVRDTYMEFTAGIRGPGAPTSRGPKGTFRTGKGSFSGPKGPEGPSRFGSEAASTALCSLGVHVESVSFFVQWGQGPGLRRLGTTSGRLATSGRLVRHPLRLGHGPVGWDPGDPMGEKADLACRSGATA